MYTIKLGKTSKKINETSHTYTNIGTYTVALKRPCTIDKPVFTLKTNESFDTLSRANYLEWLSDLQTPVNGSSYYWVNSVKFIANDLIEISCTRDPFATFKDDITGYTGMVARSSTNYDISIMDPELLVSTKRKNTLYKTKAVYHGAYNAQTTTQAFGQGNISATWQTVGKKGVRIFNIQMIPEQTLDELLNGSGTWEFGVTNPGQYIADCFILPFNIGPYSDTTLIPLGNLDAMLSYNHADITPTLIADSCKDLSFVFLPADYAGTNLKYADGDFRNYTEKFTKVKIWAPFVGSIDMPSIHLKADKIVGSYFISIVNGCGKFTLSAIYGTGTSAEEVLIMSSNINMRTEIPIAMGHTNQLQVANDITAAISTAAQVVGSLATSAASFASGGGAGLAMSAPSTVGTMAHAGNTAVNIAADWASGFQEYTCLGSSGSLAEIGGSFVNAGICIQQMDTVSEAVYHEKGRSKMSYEQIGTSSRFIAMYNPSLNVPGATPEETSYINNTLASGMYIS